ncbi:hypothetical protein [uncultured Shewanella sp.]|uniref:hypothetical protein n=1 Tax=Shewanella atlantica TaxID=271099 RepID=UPI002608FA54|nr:hypothetical protein [uncultured Shewanella sp.]
MIKTIYRQYGKVDSIYAIGFLAIAIVIGAFIAGIAAYIFLKLYEVNSDATWKDILNKCLQMALLVTIAMYIGSAAGYVIFESIFSPSSSPFAAQFDYKGYAINLLTINAIPFFIESFLALLWAVFSAKTFHLSKVKMWLVVWIGVFIVFNLGNLIVFFVSRFTLAEFLSFGFFNLLLALPKTIYFQMEQAVAVVSDPIGYFNSLWYSVKLSNGNQFYLVTQFPKWAILLLPLSVGVLGYRHLFPLEADN